MNRPNRTPQIRAWAKERTTTAVAVASLVVFAVGCVLVYWADSGNWQFNVTVAIGGGFITTGCVSALWALAGRRRFADELLQMTGLADSVTQAGLRDIVYDIMDTVESCRDALQQQPRAIDLLVVHGYAWRRALWRDILAAVRTEPVAVRVVLPDPDDQPVMRDIAALFQEDVEDVKRYVQNAATAYEGLREEQHAGGSVAIEYLKVVPRYSYYRVGATAALWVFENRRGRAPENPILLCQGGRLARLLRDDFDRTLADIRPQPESRAASGADTDV